MVKLDDVLKLYLYSANNSEAGKKKYSRLLIIFHIDKKSEVV